ncbi:serine protease [Streptomyces sp. XM4193]|uniref:S1 family peptidase n=1 Tax=Streptomyces sp. XM4193 TaxID=2929782 RepID=UPI001FF9E5CC|nr:serine protease [Streptomyces sp. XM4193]MCK1797701.1 serine protease [Streptomyces sp. XM4193]
MKIPAKTRNSSGFGRPGGGRSPLSRRALCASGVVAALVAGVAPAQAISGGEEATATYSFMASLQERESGEHFCGGTLVDRQWILTAEHCLLARDDASGNELTDPEQIRVRLGSNDRTKGGVIRHGTRIAVAPKDGEIGQDMALLKLDAPVDAALATLPDTASEPGQAVRTIGWGNHEIPEDPTGPWPPLPIKLRQLDTHVIEDDRCPGMSGEPILSRELCVEALPGEGKWPQTTRSGDSGGPLLVKAGDSWTVVGVVSRGSREQHAIFGSTHGELEWIEETVGR